MEEPILGTIRLFCELLMNDGSNDAECSLREANGLGKKCASVWQRPVDFATVANWLTFDLMGDVCFGQSFGMLSKKNLRWFLDVLPDGVQCLNIVIRPRSSCLQILLG